MLHRFTVPLAASALVLGTFALAQSKPGKPVSKPTTTVGIVVGAPRLTESPMEFDLRTRAGLYRVRPHSKTQMNEIRGGDQVRVYGSPLGLVIYNANVKLLKAKASDIADDYARPQVERLDGKPREGSQDKTVNIKKK